LSAKTLISVILNLLVGYKYWQAQSETLDIRHLKSTQVSECKSMCLSTSLCPALRTVLTGTQCYWSLKRITWTQRWNRYFQWVIGGLGSGAIIN